MLLLLLLEMGPRLDGQSTIINFLIWVGFAHHFDAGADICADADVNISVTIVMPLVDVKTYNLLPVFILFRI